MGEIPKSPGEIRRILAGMPDEEILATTIFLEAGGESIKGKLAVGWVVLNRVKLGRRHYGSGGGISGVCLKPFQFSCFNSNDPGLGKSLGINKNSQVYMSCLEAAREVLAGKVEDPTGGATHYFNPRVCGIPKWSRGMDFCGQIGRHFFYREK